MHIVVLIIGFAGVVLARAGANDALLGDSLPNIGVPQISLPGLATSAQLRELQSSSSGSGVSLERNDAFLTARAIPQTTRDTELRTLATATPSAVATARARVDVTPEPTQTKPERAGEAAAASPGPSQTPQPVADASVRVPAPSPEREARTTGAAEQKGPYFNYIVLPGDTIGGIAGKFALRLDTIQGANLTASGGDLRPGQTLRIPLSDGVLHPVQSGDTVSGLATRFGTTVDAVVGFLPNNLKSADDLRIGSEILIVGGKVELPKPAPAAAPAAATQPDTPAAPGGAASAPGATPTAPGAGAAAATNTFAAPAPAAGGAPPSFMWPFSGPISSYFGPSHPLGIDIDGFNNPTGAVAAAAGGVVTFAGGDACCSYGLYIIIQHSGGFATLYGHLSKINVTIGQQVAAGQAIGVIGSTGYSTGTHLHFEVRQGGGRLNPMAFLP